MTPADEMTFLRTLQRQIRFYEVIGRAPLGTEWFRLQVVARMAAVALVLAAGGAKAHSWYPWECCSNQDCVPVRCEDIVETPTGFTYDGVSFPKSAEKPSKDRNCHVCIRQHDKQGLCVFTIQGS